MRQDVPSLSEIVDVLTVRIEWAEQQGLLAEQAALTDARNLIVNYVMTDDRKWSLIETILHRVRGRVRVSA